MRTSSRLILLGSLFLFVTCRQEKKEYPTPVPDATQGVGASAHGLLSDDKFTALNIEISYMPGFALQDKTVNDLKDFLSALIKKPGGISITQKQVPSPGKAVSTVAEILQMESAVRTVSTSGQSIGIHVLITDGPYVSENVLGIAYRTTSIALFGKTIHDHSGGLTQVSRDFLETLVAEHELGHLLGLVNIGTPVQSAHEDAQHLNHCSNKSCLMYYATETTDILGLLTGTLPVLDAACKEDLKANGGK